MGTKSAADAAKPEGDVTKQYARRAALFKLHHKAEEYLDALCLELALALDPDKARTLQVALRQDFIEVHNEAIKNPIVMPESKSDLNALTD